MTFKLSEHEVVVGYFPKDKIKEFIRLLKENLKGDGKYRFNEEIDKLSGFSDEVKGGVK